MKHRSHGLADQGWRHIYNAPIQLPAHLVGGVSAAAAVKREFTFEDFKAGLNAQISPIATTAQRTVDTATAN